MIKSKHSLISTPLLLAALMTLSTGVTGCSSTIPRSYTQDGLIGGATGAAVGTGVGAIVGASASGVSDATAMAIGAGGGALIGIAAGVAYSAYTENQVLEENDAAIRANREILNHRQAEIDELRRELDDRSAEFRLDDARHDYIFTGPTLGNPRR